VNNLPHDRSGLLWEGDEGGFPTKLFEDSIGRWLEALVCDDESEVGGDSEIMAKVWSKERGVVSGCFVVDRLVSMQCDSSRLDWQVSEGEEIDAGDLVLIFQGPAREVLGCERTLLNVLGRMSGISTNVSKWVQCAGKLRVACTRKTDWGLLDKWAVHIGGGLTHRLSRSDALMIKENDIALMAADEFSERIADAIRGIEMDVNSAFTTVEVQTQEQAIIATSTWVEIQEGRGGVERIVLLLDNMDPNTCESVNRSLSVSGLREWCILEASGGVSLDSLEAWRGLDGIDLVSSSSLNRGVQPLDLSMIVGGD